MDRAVIANGVRPPIPGPDRQVLREGVQGHLLAVDRAVGHTAAEVVRDLAPPVVQEAGRLIHGRSNK
jgi:hypothetical protein